MRRSWPENSQEKESMQLTPTQLTVWAEFAAKALTVVLIAVKLAKTMRDREGSGEE